MTDMTTPDIEKLAAMHDEAAHVWRRNSFIRDYHRAEARRLRAHLTREHGDDEHD